MATQLLRLTDEPVSLATTLPTNLTVGKKYTIQAALSVPADEVLVAEAATKPSAGAAAFRLRDRDTWVATLSDTPIWVWTTSSQAATVIVDETA